VEILLFREDDFLLAGIVSSFDHGKQKSLTIVKVRLQHNGQLRRLAISITTGEERKRTSDRTIYNPKETTLS